MTRTDIFWGIIISSLLIILGGVIGGLIAALP
jgi:hypothetical protein